MQQLKGPQKFGDKDSVAGCEPTILQIGRRIGIRPQWTPSYL